MWSYNFEIPILMILSVILAFYFSRPRLPVRRNLIFVHLILIETFCILLDLISSIADMNFQSHSILTLKILNMFYFVGFFLRAFMLYLFAAAVLKDSLQWQFWIGHLARVPMYLGLLAAFVSAGAGSSKFPYVIFYIDETGYHSGSWYNILYVVGFCYAIMSFNSFILFRKNLPRRRESFGILFCNVIVLMSLVVRYMMPSYLLMDTFMLLAILVVYMSFGNPDFYLDLHGNVFNRLALREHLEENRTKLRLIPFGVAIRNFLEMRDIYGLVRMEEGLTVIAKYLKHLFPKALIFYCRNGRFVIIDRPGTDFAGRSHEIAERFNHPWKSQTSELYLSVGFANYEVIHGNYSADTLLRTMLKALDKVGQTEAEEPLEVSEDDVRNADREKKIRDSIEKALENSELELYLQPIMDASTGQIVGAEALSRLKDEDGKIVPPAIFIQVAETSGRINGLGELVFEKTCKFIRDVDLDTLGIEWINVNLSPSQFLRTDLADRYAAIVENYDINPRSVHLEITEEAMIDDSFLQRQIRSMGEKGFVFVLDDYGTGYSNLSRLKKCPFANIKLDMSIVWDYCREPDDILPNMIRAFKSMGFTVTAEGVENVLYASTMKEIGCDFLQGYYYSKPLPANEFVEKYRLKRVGSGT
jgi:EAL domain-containing protein (putative c-di-GMP-specific phosphodiesterase class I)